MQDILFFRPLGTMAVGLAFTFVLSFSSCASTSDQWPPSWVLQREGSSEWFIGIGGASLNEGIDSASALRIATRRAQADLSSQIIVHIRSQETSQTITTEAESVTWAVSELFSESELILRNVSVTNSAVNDAGEYWVEVRTSRARLQQIARQIATSVEETLSQLSSSSPSSRETVWEQFRALDAYSADIVLLYLVEGERIGLLIREYYAALNQLKRTISNAPLQLFLRETYVNSSDIFLRGRVQSTEDVEDWSGLPIRARLSNRISRATYVQPDGSFEIPLQTPAVTGIHPITLETPGTRDDSAIVLTRTETTVNVQLPELEIASDLSMPGELRLVDAIRGLYSNSQYWRVPESVQDYDYRLVINTDVHSLPANAAGIFVIDLVLTLELWDRESMTAMKQIEMRGSGLSHEQAHRAAVDRIIGEQNRLVLLRGMHNDQ